MSTWKERVLSVVPTYHDLLPSRFARKLSMVAGWALFALTVVSIAAVASPKWVSCQYTQTITPPRSDPFNITTAGTCSLKMCRFTETTTPDGDVERIDGPPSDVTGVPNLTSAGNGVVVTFVLLIVCSPFVAFVTWIHGWGRIEDQRKSYVLAVVCNACLVVTALVAWAIYLSAKPASKSQGYSLGWGFWLSFALSLAYLAVCILVVVDKPSGLVRLTKAGVKPDNALTDVEVAAAGSGTGSQLHASLLQQQQTSE